MIAGRDELATHDTEGRKVISSWREHPGKRQDVCEHDQMLKKLGDLRGAYGPLLHNLKNALGRTDSVRENDSKRTFLRKHTTPLLTECSYAYHCYLIAMMIV